jgi:hypothetical protein
MAGVVQAERQTGIPESTIRYWMDRPEFAEFRAKAREEMAEEVKVVAHLAWKRIAETIGTMEPRDALFAAEKATSLHLLMSGEATSRSEHRDLTDPDDAGLDALEQVIAAGSPFALAVGLEPRRNGSGKNGSH